MRRWLAEHGQAFVYSLGQLFRAPLPTALTVTVIAVALALPLLLMVLVENLDAIGGGLDDGRQISVFLDPDLDESAAMDVLARFEELPGIRRVDLVSRDAALAELDEMSWVNDVVSALGSNPLPVTILIEPEQQYTSVAKLSELAERLGKMKAVDEVLLDIVWLQRLDALIELVRRTALVLAVLLGIAVLLTIGNTVRLMVLNRAEEILVINRVGGTNAFIRRPFVYSGLLQGLAGGALAVGLVILVGWLLGQRVEALVAAYGASFVLDGPRWQAIVAVVAVGGVLGWLASWLAVGRHLRLLRPR